MFAALNQNGLFPINYWAMQNNTRLLQAKEGSGRYLLAQVPQHPAQYGYAIPVVDIYRGVDGDVFEVSGKNHKMTKLHVINPDDYKEYGGS